MLYDTPFHMALSMALSMSHYGRNQEKNSRYSQFFNIKSRGPVKTTSRNDYVFVRMTSVFSLAVIVRNNIPFQVFSKLQIDKYFTEKFLPKIDHPKTDTNPQIYGA